MDFVTSNKDSRLSSTYLFLAFSLCHAPCRWNLSGTPKAAAAVAPPDRRLCIPYTLSSKPLFFNSNFRSWLARLYGIGCPLSLNPFLVWRIRLNNFEPCLWPPCFRSFSTATPQHGQSSPTTPPETGRSSFSPGTRPYVTSQSWHCRLLDYLNRPIVKKKNPRAINAANWIWARLPSSRLWITCWIIFLAKSILRGHFSHCWFSEDSLRRLHNLFHQGVMSRFLISTLFMYPTHSVHCRINGWNRLCFLYQRDKIQGKRCNIGWQECYIPVLCPFLPCLVRSDICTYSFRCSVLCQNTW